MLRTAAIVLSLASCLSSPALADCVKPDKAFEGTLKPLSSDYSRFFTLTPGKHTIRAKVTWRSAPGTGCRGNDKGIDFVEIKDRRGNEVKCKKDDQEGPAKLLSCRMDAKVTGIYVIVMRNPGCRTTQYDLICKNGHHRHYAEDTPTGSDLIATIDDDDDAVAVAGAAASAEAR